MAVWALKPYLKQAKPPAVIEYACGACGAEFPVSLKQAGTLLIKQQTEDLFSSISNLLRGDAELQ